MQLRRGNGWSAANAVYNYISLGLIPLKGRKKVKKHFKLRDSWLEALSNAQQ